MVHHCLSTNFTAVTITTVTVTSIAVVSVNNNNCYISNIYSSVERKLFDAVDTSNTLFQILVV